MKTLKTISSIFEQESKVKGQSLIFNSQPKNNPTDYIKIQWAVQYKWPKKNPDLGDYEEILKFIDTATKGDAKLIKDSISKAGQNTVLGISKDSQSTADNRLFGVDSAQVNAFIYLFQPNRIDYSKVPSSKKLTGTINNFQTLVVDNTTKNYVVSDNAQPISDNKPDGNSTKPTQTVTVLTLLTDGNKYNKWYTNEKGIKNLITQTAERLEKKFKPADLNLEADAAPVFWQFVNSLPSDLRTIANAESLRTDIKTKYTPELKAAIEKVLGEAAKFDPSGISGVNLNTLNHHLYNKLALATLIIGLNRGAISIDFYPKSNHAPSDEYYVAIEKALDMAIAVMTNAASPTSGPFDGTSVNTELELAKIVSGTLITRYKGIAADLDTIDKVKAAFNSSVIGSNWSTASDPWGDTVATLPWKKDDDTKKEEFTNIQKLVLGAKNTGPYGPATQKGFADYFAKSAIK